MPEVERGDKFRRKWTDLTFLNIQSLKHQQQCGVLESHFSFVLCGSDNTRWTGYAFADTEFDEEELDEDGFPSGGFHLDPIALNGLDANMPIRDARQYFLFVVKMRMGQVLKEWENLARVVDLSVERYVRQHRFYALLVKTGGATNASPEIPAQFDEIATFQKNRRPNSRCQNSFGVDPANYGAPGSIVEHYLETDQGLGDFQL
jgi:hypothetical protein